MNIPLLSRRTATPAADGSVPIRLNLTEVGGHLTFTPATVTAWYMLPEMPWPFRGDLDRESLLTAAAGQVAGLAGHRLHMRRTTRLFDSAGWARRLHHDTQRQAATVPAGWAEHLGAAVAHLNRAGHSNGHTMLGVEWPRTTLTQGLRGLLRHRTTEETREDLLARVAVFDQAMAAYGLEARPATSDELVWLLYRSVALGLDPPAYLLAGFGPEDVLALAERVRPYRDRYDTCTLLVDPFTGDETHVAVLTLGRMEEIEVPQRHEPWQYLIHQAPFPVELSSRVGVLDRDATSKGILLQLQRILHQQRDYRIHETPEPADLERAAVDAAAIRDQIDSGQPEDSTRAHGWHRFAVTAPTRRECLERAAELTRIFHQRQRHQLVHTRDQLALWQEFIPGQPDARNGYLRRMPVKLLAAGVPQAAAPVGDGRGDLLGYTPSGNQPVFLDLHAPMEGAGDKSGLAIMVAEPGGGKSTLLGALTYLNVRRGVRTTLLDPSGPLARLAELPALRPHTRVVHLRGAQRGTLAPYALIPEPRRSTFEPGPDGDEEFNYATANARAERRMLAVDVAKMLLPSAVLREASTDAVLRSATRKVPTDPTSTLDDVIAVLHQVGDGQDPEPTSEDMRAAAKNIANLLEDIVDWPSARLFFGTPPAGHLDTTAPLTVITMAGLQLPDQRIAREYWTQEQQISLAVLHAAVRLAALRCYSGDMHARKLVGLDEAHFLAELPSGLAFLIRLARDSRKWNTATLLASQNPRDILGLDDEIANLVSTVFVGRIAEDETVAANALRLLRIPPGAGYEQTLASLSASASDERLPYREFMLRTWRGAVGRFRADFGWMPELMTTLNTTPGGSR